MCECLFKIERARVKNLDLTITLINTSGQMLSIYAVAQRTSFPWMTVVPVTGGPRVADSITVIGSSNSVTVPLGARGPSGTMGIRSSKWRVHCTELLENTTPEFVLMVDRPYRTKMIEGFIVQGSYDYDVGGETKTQRIGKGVMFDDYGYPRLPTSQEIERLRTYRKPQVIINNVVVNTTGTGTFRASPMLPANSTNPQPPLKSK
jgi:hypothetical protein